MLFGKKTQEQAVRDSFDTEQYLYHAKCKKYGQHFLIEAYKQSGSMKVVNFVDLTDTQAESANTPAWEKDLASAETLRACPWCGNRKVGGCACCSKKGLCPGGKGQYRLQCLYCNELVPVSAGRSKRLEDLRISVTSPNYDNIGEILRSLNLPFRPFSETGFDCDVLFVNCGTSDYIDHAKLNTFVENGGCAYMSDFAEEHLRGAFPGVADIRREGKKGTVVATVLDSELKSIIGSHIMVNFNLGAWGVIHSHTGTDLIITAEKLTRQPLMFEVKRGKGSVFYTSFHNHVQADEKEKTVLQVMLLRQIGSVTNQSVQEVGEMLGLNIQTMARKMGK